MLTDENAQKIAELLIECSEKYNGIKICNDYNRDIRKYADKIYELSNWHIQLEMYLSDANIESGHYKITARCDNIDDKKILQQYWTQVK